MRKTEERGPIEVKYCDTCGKNCGYSCPHCSKDWCSDCMRQGAVMYWNSPFVGYVVAVYCKPCDLAESESSQDPLYRALQDVAALRRESDELQRRGQDAEAAIKRLLGDRVRL